MKDQMHVTCGTYRRRREMHIRGFFWGGEENQNGNPEDHGVDTTTLN